MEILLVFQIIVVVAMVAVILIQKGGSDGLTGGSSPNAFMTGRASANLFTRTTAILATLFILNSLALAYIASHTEREGSVLDKVFSESEKGKAGASKAADKLADKVEEELEAPLADAEEKAVEGKSASEKNDEVKSKEDKDNSSSIEKTLKKAKDSADATAEKIKETSDKIESSKEEK